MIFPSVSRELRYHRGKKRINGRTVAYAVEAAVCLGLLAGGLYAFYTFVTVSSTFEPRQISIDGERVLSEAEIEMAALSSGSANLVKMNPEEIAENIKSLPYVRSCNVERVFPDTLLIRIEEREPVAALVVDNHLYAIDRQGVVLEELSPTETFEGPLITNVAGLEHVEPGDTIGAPPVLDALAVWTAFSHLKHARDLDVSELSLAKNKTVEMICEQLPYEILWTGEDVETQAMHLSLLWNEEGRDGLKCNEYLDLRFGKDVVCR